MQKVLAVDNDLFFLDFIRDLLEKSGYAVETAENGLSALNILEDFTPDIMLIDLIMPNIDGKRLCKILRRMEHLNHTRIIILSAAAKEASIDAVALGVERIIAKGPLQVMGENILTVLKQEAEPTAFSTAVEVLTAGNIRERGITSELLSTKKHFELILERMTEGVLEITAGGKIVYANRVACLLTGLPEEKLLLLDFLQLFSLEDRLWIEKKMKEIRQEDDGFKGEEILALTKYLVTMDLLEIKGDEGKRIVILNDVTERKKLEESIIRSERLAATGQLAASIAHQINSPLQGITALLSVMKECGADDSDFSGNIRLLEGAFGSIRETVRKLLDLNRPGQAEKQLVNIHEIIRNTVSLVGTHLRQAGIKIRLNFHKESIYLNASPQELEHVFLNLINNAIEAISAEKDRAMGKCGGEITIGTKQDKDLLLIEISDSGPGISEDNLNRIFDAFYTRKGNLGMGIGLAVCKSVIEKHDGTIEAIKKADCGATFSISLPLKK